MMIRYHCKFCDNADREQNNPTRCEIKTRVVPDPRSNYLQWSLSKRFIKIIVRIFLPFLLRTSYCEELDLSAG